MGERLDSWKAIADHLGREVRTVQRWERERRLPVHRLPGGDKPRVYALKSELDQWLQAGKAASAVEPSAAVLPLVNLTGDRENEYFCDGLADEIINALTRIPGLRVTARTSSFAFRGREQDVREIGARLGAAALLEGSVRHCAGRVRVSVQLVSAEDGYHLWSECYDREMADVFAIQDEIAHAVAASLRLRLAPKSLVDRPTGDLEAYNLWLKGRCAGARWTMEGIAQARRLYAAAMARDPRFPLPYVSDAEMLFEASWFGLTPPATAAREAKEAVLKALALDDALGEAHSLLGSLLGILEYDWQGAGRAFARALDLSPGSSMVLLRHAWYFLAPLRRVAEAASELRRALALDPLSPLLHSILGMVLILAREYDEAETECRLALQMAPGFWWPHFFLGAALMLKGEVEAAIGHFQQAWDLLGPDPLAIGNKCCVFGMVGRREEAERAFAQLEEMAHTSEVSALAFAWACLGLGDDRVFDWLGRAIDERSPAVVHLPTLAIYDRIRDDPRFVKLLTRMGLGGANIP
jgi:TolB-like protein/Flp pilus assembly protein TadD